MLELWYRYEQYDIYYKNTCYQRIFLLQKTGWFEYYTFELDKLIEHLLDENGKIISYVYKDYNNRLTEDPINNPVGLLFEYSYEDTFNTQVFIEFSITDPRKCITTPNLSKYYKEGN